MQVRSYTIPGQAAAIASKVIRQSDGYSVSISMVIRSYGVRTGSIWEFESYYGLHMSILAVDGIWLLWLIW